MVESQPQVSYSLMVVQQLVGCLPYDVTCMSTTEAKYIGKAESFKKTKLLKVYLVSCLLVLVWRVFIVKMKVRYTWLEIIILITGKPNTLILSITSFVMRLNRRG